MEPVNGAHRTAGPAVHFCSAAPGRFHSIHFTQELTMADLAFVATTVAVFALVALIARGVTKL
ncbi:MULTISPECIES: hypothetical protein [unclassified Streptomyces]|uniref:hypothetical protein n=1 Tax=unclassified Streptomyces TaxID=2593676 RepID=UPI00381FCFA3